MAMTHNTASLFINPKHQNDPYGLGEMKETPMPEVKQQHEKIKGYRTLSQQEIDLMNEGKELSEKVGAWIAKLRTYPATGADGVPTFNELPSLDQRAISIGATELQTGFMWAIRGIAQPSTF